MNKTTDPYEDDKDFADYIDRVRDEVILKYHRDYKESLTSEDCIKAGKPIRTFVHNLESLEDALRPTRKFNTKNNDFLWETFQSELNNENLSYEARETARDYFIYLAELADRANSLCNFITNNGMRDEDIDVVNENLMWLGFKGYSIRIEKDHRFNNGELQISVHSKKDDGDMLAKVNVPEKAVNDD